MAKELPYFQFNIQEWQNGDITSQTDSAQGVFINVCCFYWANNCELTEDRLLKRFKNKAKTIQKLIECGSIKRQNGIISISFLDQQLFQIEKDRKFFSDAGKLGQKVKKSKAPLNSTNKPPLSNKIDKIDKIESGETALRQSLTPFKEKYGVELLRKFFAYWTEPNKSRTKCRYQLEKTWDVARRLKTWSERERPEKTPPQAHYKDFQPEPEPPDGYADLSGLSKMVQNVAENKKV